MATGSVLAGQWPGIPEVTMRASLGLALGLVAALTPLPGARAVSRQPADATAGRALYLTHCATCHGKAGRGDGPMAPHLSVAPANLATIAARHEGVFPTESIQRIVDGRQALTLHGSSMPIWGDAFSPVGNAAADEVAAAKIRAIVAYLRSIQDHAGE
jgi:mono/diheme cytochrome c family protein